MAIILHLIAGRADVDTLSVLITRIKLVVIDSAVLDVVVGDFGVLHGTLEANTLGPEKNRERSDWSTSPMFSFSM